MRLLVPFVLVAILAGCGSGSAVDSQPVGATGLELSHPAPGTTLLRNGERTRELSGEFEIARLGSRFAPDPAIVTSDRTVLQDVANGASTTRSRFAVVDSTLVEAPHLIELDGRFEYDAVSPSVGTVFLTSYLSVEDPLRYVVRAYDVASATLDPTPVVDKSAVAEGPMAGRPVARAISPGGDWVYTAYRGEHAFVHALNTVERFAVCIDLPERAASAEDWSLSLDDGGQHLVATSPSTGTLARIRTHDFVMTVRSV